MLPREFRVLSLFLPLLAAVPPSEAQPSNDAPSVAIVAGQQIDADRLSKQVGNRLFQLESQAYHVKREALDAVIFSALIEAEAKARRLEAADFERQELEARVKVTDEEVRSVYDTFRDKFGGMVKDQALVAIRRGITQSRQQDAKRALGKELASKHGVQVLLEPPRMTLHVEGAPFRGPKDAPVTVIEFSDYQCPFCASIQPTLKRLEEHFAGQVRRVLVDLPLPSHPDAPKAAEAAHCAGDQGRYWEMHEKLFAGATTGALKVQDLKRYAVALSLDSSKFDECLDSGRHRDDVQNFKALAIGYGVGATPTLFVNGRMFSGGARFELLSDAIEEELSRLAKDKGQTAQRK